MVVCGEGHDDLPNTMPFQPFGGFATSTLLTLAQRFRRDTLPCVITFCYQHLPNWQCDAEIDQEALVSHGEQAVGW